MNQTASSDRAASGIAVRPLTDSVGAEIIGVDLSVVTDGQFAAIAEAFDRHAGLLFRDQCLEPEALVTFSRRFGDLDHAPVMENGQTAVPGLPEVYLVSNIEGADGKPIGSLVAVEAHDRAGAEQIAAGDPYAKAGLFESVEILPWNWVFKAPEAK